MKGRKEGRNGGRKEKGRRSGRDQETEGEGN